MACSTNPPREPLVGNPTVEQGGKALIVHTLIGERAYQYGYGTVLREEDMEATEHLHVPD